METEKSQIILVLCIILTIVISVEAVVQSNKDIINELKYQNLLLEELYEIHK